MKTGRRGAQAGYTYLGLLLAILAASLAVAAGVTLLSNDMRRDKEAELLFAGDEIRRALELYHSQNTAGMQPFPRTLDALLRDPNQLSVQRYLRRIYRDPVHDPDVPGAAAENGFWVLIRDGNGQIVGVHSNSMREPLRRSGFPKQYEGFRQARRYADWQFLAAGGVPADPKAGTVAEPRSFIATPVVPVVPVVPVAPPAAAAPQQSLAAPPPPPPLELVVPAVPLTAPVTPPAPAPTVVPAAPAPAAIVAPAVSPSAAGAAGAAGAAAPAAPATPAASGALAAPAQATPAEAARPSSSPQPFVIRAPAGF